MTGKSVKSALLAALLAAGASSAWAAESSDTKGFVVTHFAFASYDDEAADCPDGLNLSAKDIYLQSLPAGERDRLSKPEAQKELWTLLYAPGGNLGPGKRTHNRCADPADFESPPLRTVQGKIADGMDLDGGDPANTCAHQKFTSPDGKSGIDNQLWRAMGCIRGWRHGADIEKYAQDNIKAGEYTILLEIQGLKDPRNDAHVKVGIYSSTDQASVDAQGNVLPDASLQVHEDPKYRTVADGKVVDGVVMTKPVDLRLKYRSAGYVDTDFYIRGARLKLTLKPDGTASGMLGGYYDVETLYDGFIRQPQVVTSVLLGYSCPAVYAALNQFADGYPDSKTGKCTAISTAFRLDAIPAFVIHPKDEKKMAEAGSAK
ncbi:MAG TPA: hypothetical protein VKZ79_08025 [Alphaproteobacteria bacterium]|nr:hypothetical protein [Alphaproteobacteria bacterium]